MGLLDGGLQSVFYNAFAPIFLTATLYPVTTIDGEGGEITEVEGSGISVKAVKDRATEAMRGAGDYTTDDVSLIILQKGVGVALASGMILEWTDGTRYRLGTPIDADPANATWTCRGTPVHGG